MQIKRFSKVFLVSLALLAIATLIGCGGGGGGGAPPPPETYTISATGGEGTGTGGDGGDVWISSLGANEVVVKTSGSVDTSFTVPAISFNSDVNLWTVTSSITVKVYPSGDDSAVSANEYHMHVNTNALNKRNAGNTADEAVTGLHVNSGVTLTLALNNSLYGNNGLDSVYIWFDKDIWNQGTITVKDLLTGKDEVGSTTRVADGTAFDMGDLDLRTLGQWVNQGTITTKGGDSTTVTGGNGGEFYAGAGGYMINTGTVDTSGGNGTSGGNAKPAGLEVTGLDVNDKIWNTGPIYAKGGEGTKGTNGTGGNGAGIALYTSAEQAHIYNSGTLDASGGNGTTGGGNGAPNWIDIWSSRFGGGGNIINSGKLYANGGNASAINSFGGDGGIISLYGYGGNIRTNGAIEAKGGDGIVIGGSGGEIDIITTYFDIYHPAGYMQVSNHLNVNGGKANAGAGGRGGYIYIYHESLPAAGNIELYGFANINANGALTDGYGGLIEIEGSPITIQSGITFSVKGALPSYPDNNGYIFIGISDVTGDGTYTAP